MKMKNIAIFVILALIYCGTSSLHAMSSLKSFTGMGATKDAASVDNDQLVRSFVSAQSKTIEAQIYLAKAFDLKDQATLLETERAALSGGSLDKDGIKKSREVSANAQSAISAKINEDAALTTEGKKEYTKAVPVYLEAVKLTVLLTNMATQYTSNMGKSGLFGMTKGVQSVAYVAKETPAFSKQLYDTSKQVLTYANKNKISVPKDATSVLGNL